MEAADAAATALRDRVAVVAGGTRGAGRGIAVALGTRGATVYVTGRSTAAGRSELGRSETIEKTAALVDTAGERGIFMRCDHSRSEDVDALCARLEADGGCLDVLVNDIGGGDALVRWGRALLEHDLDAGLRAWRNAVETHLITSHRLAPLLVARGSGLVIEVTDGDSDRYRGSLGYDLAKASAIRLAVAQASELAPHGVAAVAYSRIPALGGDARPLRRRRGALARRRRAGSALRALGDAGVRGSRGGSARDRSRRAALERPGALVLGLAREYGFRDDDGSQPDWGRWFDEVVLTGMDPAVADVARYR